MSINRSRDLLNCMSSDATASQSPETNGGRAPTAEAAEHERQFQEILEFSPAALLIVDEDGRLLFHNARLRELLGYQKHELELIETRKFWDDDPGVTPQPRELADPLLHRERHLNACERVLLNAAALRGDVPLQRPARLRQERRRARALPGLRRHDSRPLLR